MLFHSSGCPPMTASRTHDGGGNGASHSSSAVWKSRETSDDCECGDYFVGAEGLGGLGVGVGDGEGLRTTGTRDRIPAEGSGMDGWKDGWGGVRSMEEGT